MKLQTRFVAQTVAMAFFAAIIGFSYAMITQASPNAANAKSAVGSRATGTATIRFLAPVLVSNTNDYDLGDALYGTVITRYVTATGGLRPYQFAAPGLATVLGANSTLKMERSGVVSGFASATTPNPAVTFPATVTGGTLSDLNATPVPTETRNFHLTLFATSSNLFRFANDHLNNGVLGQSYLGKIDTIGGKGTVIYSIVPGTIALNGSILGTGNSLEDSMGLSLASNGSLFGRPLKTGLVTFTAHAVDAAQRAAKDRSNSIPDQIFAFNIEDSRITATDSTILSVSVRGDTALANSDTVKFKAFMNLGGTNSNALKNQQFTLLFGGNAYTGFLDPSGKIISQRGGTLVFPDGTTLTGVVGSVNGTVTGTLTRANVSKGLNAEAITNLSTKRVGIAIIVHNLVAASDTIEFETKHIGTKYALNYVIGQFGKPLGGAFQIYDARGLDGLDIAGNKGDAWYSKFLIAPRFGIDDTAGYGSINDITVRIGTNFSQLIPNALLATTNTGRIVLPQRGTGASIARFVIDPAAYSGYVATNTLSESTTGLSQGQNLVLAVSNFYNMSIDINRTAGNATFNGEDAKAMQKVHPFGTWVDRNSKLPKP
ncbi:MAG: hypothetical protein WCT04_17140 [Planctomycetota bacterium]